ncbi:hypothetical protein [Streptomyces sp. NPDC017202]|uniref:hypothetical protein n=1 Tax=Streptomyces sp. NPDC017202 TaxID=3364981 RepID=UPI0037AABED2
MEPVLLVENPSTRGFTTLSAQLPHFTGRLEKAHSFFEQCQHRMACARCDFYTLKNSSKAQLLEAKKNLQRMLASIPLTEDERAAVDDGQDAVDALLDRLTDVPTPAGPTPRQLGLPATVTTLPIVEGRHGNRNANQQN